MCIYIKKNIFCKFIHKNSKFKSFIYIFVIRNYVKNIRQKSEKHWFIGDRDTQKFKLRRSIEWLKICTFTIGKFLLGNKKIVCLFQILSIIIHSSQKKKYE